MKDGSEKDYAGIYCASTDLSANDYARFYNRLAETCRLSPGEPLRPFLHDILRKVVFPTSYKNLEMHYRILNGEDLSISEHLGALGTRAGYCADTAKEMLKQIAKLYGSNK
jgi:hypothetical protein